MLDPTIFWSRAFKCPATFATRTTIAVAIKFRMIAADKNHITGELIVGKECVVDAQSFKHQLSPQQRLDQGKIAFIQHLEDVAM